MPSCYSICTVSVLVNVIRCPSHPLRCHTSIRRFFLGRSLSDKPRGGSRLMSALCHTKIPLPLEHQPRGYSDLVLSMDIYEGPISHRTIPPIYRYHLSPLVYVIFFLPWMGASLLVLNTMAIVQLVLGSAKDDFAWLFPTVSCE